MHKFVIVLNNTCCQTELKCLIQKPRFSHAILKILFLNLSLVWQKQDNLASPYI